MGEEILVANFLDNWLFWAFGYGLMGTFFGIILFARFMSDKNMFAATIVAVVYTAGWLLIAGPGWSVRVNDARHNEALYINAAQIQKEYASARLYIKEQVNEPGVWGETKGSFGGFLFIGGTIYGRIDSGRVITLVYRQPNGISINEQYGGKHLAFSKPLVDIVLETIPAGEKPYLMFPEAFIAKDAYGKIKVYPWKPHLYLPEGWVIL